MGDKELKKKLRNRQSAQRARDRQKARMKWLEREVAIVTLKNQTLQQENIALKKMLEKQMNSEMPIPKILNNDEFAKPITDIKIQTEDKENVSEDENIVAEDLSVKTTNVCFNNEVPNKENHFSHFIPSVQKFGKEAICQRQEKEFSPRHPNTVLSSSPDQALPIPNYRSHMPDDNHQYLPLPNNLPCPKMSSPEDKLRHEKAAYISPFLVGQMFPSYFSTAYGIVPFFAPGRENPANLCNPKRPASSFWGSGINVSKRSKVHSYESESSGSSVLSSDESHSM